MAKNEEQNKFWRILYSPLAFIVLLIIFTFMVRSFWSVYQHERLSSKDRQRLSQELAAAQQRSAVLQDQVNSLETPQGVDREIRSKFNVSKVGEGVAIIMNNSDVATSVATSSAKTFWQSVLGVFGY